MSSSKTTKVLPENWEACVESRKAAQKAAAEEERAIRQQAIAQEAKGDLSGDKRAFDRPHTRPEPIPTKLPLPSNENDVPVPLSLSLNDDFTDESPISSISRLQEELRRERDQHALCQENLRDAESRRDKLENDLEVARRELELATEAVHEKEYERHLKVRDRLKEQLKDVRGECDELRRQRRELEARIDELEKENRRMNQLGQKIQGEHEPLTQKDVNVKESLKKESLQSAPSSSRQSKKTSGRKVRPKPRMVERKGVRLLLYPAAT
ncbi:uncharacterized protein Z520_08612 [Fonsecaea multimorphosa CBS 102226]|uniref:Uncharacterized protein n=1 Tax=Fonsecaea multimorphosa CBS 102226 TaxID=1442371 RepID=A0A0D2JQ69_9EURO|nr:uncharacterized protein Z520_08612 [Fonsecaea multimorphosa CBS 102226]KIX95492.1 hypothetical protein Z520_08612 [Fonsecaea multimorphosa CBS 102226]OAL21338.1 hypothetical protein AYO22_08061 [Fonsecaea multimorphosa]